MFLDRHADLARVRRGLLDDVLANLHIFKGLSEEEESAFNDAFSEVTGN